MTTTANLLEVLRNIISRIEPHKHAVDQQGDHQYSDLVDELNKRFTQRSATGATFTHSEHEIHIGRISTLRDQAKDLDEISNLGLSAAPTAEALLPAGKDLAVLLLRYPACPDEELFPF
ncbi:MAG TPA: hypothetical protein PKU97_20130, partial [Kofleriaceae bacterium]|nr:hypothetical protein [Kofleriaceae bacterium]